MAGHGCLRERMAGWIPLKWHLGPVIGPHRSHADSNSMMSESWWRHQMETFSALLAICAGNSPVPGESHAQRPVMRSFDVFFDLRLNKRLSKQSWGWWFETLSCPLWRHCNDHSGQLLPAVGYVAVAMLVCWMIWYCYCFLSGFKCTFQIYSSAFSIS